MKTSLIGAASLLLALSGTALAQEPAQGFKEGVPVVRADDGGYRTYRCVVLGDNAACPAAPAADGESSVQTRIEPGSYARYLLWQGHPRAVALAEAARIGEHPVIRVVRVTRHTLTDLERYDRWLGRPAPEERSEATISARHLVANEAGLAGEVAGRSP